MYVTCPLFPRSCSFLYALLLFITLCCCLPASKHPMLPPFCLAMRVRCVPCFSPTHARHGIDARAPTHETLSCLHINCRTHCELQCGVTAMLTNRVKYLGQRAAAAQLFLAGALCRCCPSAAAACRRFATAAAAAAGSCCCRRWSGCPGRLVSCLHASHVILGGHLVVHNGAAGGGMLGWAGGVGGSIAGQRSHAVGGSKARAAVAPALGSHCG